MKFESLKDKKRNVILSTDIAGDCDDVGAIKVLHTYADELGFEILGMCNCTTRRDGTRTLYAINKFLGKPDIPLGEYKKHTLPVIAESSKYIDEISKRFGDRAPEAKAPLEFYREILSNAEDDSVVIVTIGFFTDMAELIMSGPDEYSPLTGVELIKRKVSYIVSMAHKFPKGHEFNIRLAPIEAKIFFDHCPVDVYISDFDLGRGLRVGFYGVDESALRNNPVFESYRIFSDAYHLEHRDNNSYDLTAVQFAAVGEGEYYRVNPTPYKMRFYRDDSDNSVPIVANAAEFVPTENGNVFLIEAVDKGAIKAELDRRLLL